ncbi:MAG TPA: hypothetical protein VHY91_27650 [Pirellulales bacterium]|jgi:hypothetical protein|nr:hypothetical protein [Pirellulales bacterium]
MRRPLFGIVWFLVLYFGSFFVIGAVAGGVAANRYRGNPAMAQASAREAAMGFVNNYHAHILAGAGVLTVLGSGAGILPGTRKTREVEPARY